MATTLEVVAADERQRLSKETRGDIESQAKKKKDNAKQYLKLQSFLSNLSTLSSS